MNACHSTFINELERLDGRDDDPGLEALLYELTEALEGIDPAPVFPAIFRFLEAHPNAEVGNPGPLVHMIERSFPGGFEHLLLESLSRKAVPHTVWMANRLLKSPRIEAPLRSVLLSALASVARDPAVDTVTRERATAFLDHQRA